MNKKLLRELPKVDDLLSDVRLKSTALSISRHTLLKAIRNVIDETRRGILNGQIKDQRLNIDKLVERILELATDDSTMNLKPVINATGVVLHTNLGRAPLAASSIEAIAGIAGQYNTLEYDIETGGRGSRYSHVEALISEITGAPAALVVNNNAAAMMLILSALAKEREVIVSRGELVEIGGSFRVPEIMQQSGSILYEVGTTNKTHPADYENAIHQPETAMLLKVHTSNYRIVGFTEEVSLEQMVEIGKKHDIPVVYDLGCGLIDHFSDANLMTEETVRSSLKSGADIVSFSGDKLLGGPQAGIIVGSKALIEKMKRHPLTRALRIDKLTLVALEATLRLYLDDQSALTNIPVLNMLTLKPEILAIRAEQLHDKLKPAEKWCDLALEAGMSQVGGGSMPTVELPTTLVKLKPQNMSVGLLQAKLRGFTKPIIVRIYNDNLYLDVRTIQQTDYDYIAETIIDILGEE